MREILLYSRIDSESSSEFIKEFAELSAEDEDVTVRVNCPGGSPEYAFGAAAKFKEHKGKKSIKVDGQASSSALFFICYAEKENVEALDTAEFLLHRAAYPQWFERDQEYMTEAVTTNLERINKSLKAAFENRVDVPMFEAMKNVKLKDVFSLDSRIDVTFSAAEAKKIGLIGKVVPITPSKKAEIQAFVEKAACREYGIAAFKTEEVEAINQESNFKNNKMTLEELKVKHPEVYASAVAEGVAKEADRVGSIMVFAHLDAEACKEAIKSGKHLTETQKSEFALKALSPDALKALEKSAAPAAKTAETTTVEKTEAEKSAEAFKAEVKQELAKN